MNDEATTYFEDIIDQMTLGHQFLKRTFNITVDIGWQIDPFGHSSGYASLLCQMGFNALFLGRIDYQDKEMRLNNRNMEMVWVPDSSNNLFTHINYHFYWNPPSFCFDQYCHDA